MALSGEEGVKIIISTPSAKTGWYWSKLSSNNGDRDIEELCKEVADGKIYQDVPGCYWFVDEIGTVKLILHYSCHPVYSQKKDYLKYREIQDNADVETIEREYNLQFIDPSVSVFDSALVQAGAVGELCDYEPGFEYYLGIDTATTGQDNCVCVVLRYCPIEQHYSLVSFYQRKNETSAVHMYKISLLIDKYKPTIVGVETNSSGAIYFEQLSRQHKTVRFEGVTTTAQSKEAMIANLNLALEKKVLSYPPKNPLIEELLSFVRSGGKQLGAAGNKKDDMVMATAIVLYCSPLNARKKPEHYDLSKMVLMEEDD